MVGWPGSPAKRRSTNYGDFKVGAFPQQALAAWGPSRINGLNRAGPSDQFPTELLEPPGLPAGCAANLLVLAGGEWLALRSSRSIWRRKHALPTLVAGRGHRWHQGSDGRDLDTALAKAGFRDGPCLRFPRTNPQTGSSRDSRSGSPRTETTSPQLDPQPAAHPLTRSLYFPSEEAYPGHLPLEAVVPFQESVPADKKGKPVAP